MAKFVRRSAFFAVGLAVMMLAAHVLYEVKVRQESLFWTQVAWFRNPEVKPVVLFIGDSRMAMNLDPARLPPGFYNWSFHGETLRHMYLRTKFALETKPSIRYLVLGLEDLTLSEPRAQLREISRQMLFADLVDLTEAYPPSAKFLLRTAVLHYLPLINASNRGRLGEALAETLWSRLTGEPPQRRLGLACGTLRFSSPVGWGRMDAAKRREVTNVHVRKLLSKSNDVSEMRDLFRRLLALADRHNVKVIGLRNPVSDTYEIAAAKYDTASVHAFFARAPLYGMLDYKAVFANRLSLFYDGDHLNDRGAARFTDRVVRDLRTFVNVPADAKAPCQIVRPPPPFSWPYHDIFSEWLSTPACRNLGGRCGDVPSRQPPGWDVPQKEADLSPTSVPAEKSPGPGAEPRAATPKATDHHSSDPRRAEDGVLKIDMDYPALRGTR